MRQNTKQQTPAFSGSITNPPDSSDSGGFALYAGNRDNPFLFAYDFGFEYVNDIHIGTAEHSRPCRLPGNGAAIAENIDIRKGYVHGHGAEFSPLRIVVKRLSYAVSAVASALADFIDNCNPYLRPLHGISLGIPKILRPFSSVIRRTS